MSEPNTKPELSAAEVRIVSAFDTLDRLKERLDDVDELREQACLAVLQFLRDLGKEDVAIQFENLLGYEDE